MPAPRRLMPALFSVIGLALAGVLVAPAAAQAADPVSVPLPHGSFDSPVVQGAQSVPGVDGWDNDYAPYGCGVGLADASVIPSLPPGQQAVTPDPWCGGTEISQSFAVLPGHDYELRYTDFSTSSYSLSVSVWLDSGAWDSSDVWGDSVETHALAFTASGATERVTLSMYGYGYWGEWSGLGGVSGLTLVDKGAPAPLNNNLGPEQPPAGDLIVNGGFEDPQRGGWSTFGSIPGWTTVGGCGIEVQHWVAGAPYRGNQLVELDSGCPSRIRQTVATKPGHDYELRYAFSARPGTSREDNHVRVFANGTVVDEQYADPARDTDYTLHTVRIHATTSSLDLDFADLGYSNGSGSYLDSVSLVELDTTAPTMDLPKDLTAEAASADGRHVDYTAAASDDLDPHPTTSCTPGSGSLFALGTTRVSCTATDAGGNTSTGSFDVTVVDTTAPDLSAAPTVAPVEATGPGGARVTYDGPTATDAVDGTDPVTCLPASGATFALGSTTVTCTSTDRAGNSATVDFPVSVRDTTAPALTLPDPVTLDATSPTGTTVGFTTSAVDVVDGTTAVTCDPASGATFAIGTSTVRCTSTDAAGNRASGTFTVTVLGAAEQAANLTAYLTGVGESGLTAKAQAVAASIARGSTTSARGQLGALQNSTAAALKAGRITQAQADAVTTAVNHLLATLG